MIKSEKIDIDGNEAEGISVNTENTVILVIKAKKGFLGCGYFDINVADKVGDAAAIVTGVKTFYDMLNAKVVKVSEKAKELGIKEGTTGRAALKLMF